MLTTLAVRQLWKPNERRSLNKEFAEHAKAADAAFENDAEQYFRHQAKAERAAERADRAHERHMVRESKYLKKEALQHRLAQESLGRGDTAKFAHHEYKAARYHNKAGRTHEKRHYPAPAGHSHHHHPDYRGDIPTPGYEHEEVPMGAYGGVPPLGTAPIGISSGTIPAGPMPLSATVTSMASGVMPTPAVAPMPLMGSMGGYSEEYYSESSPYFEAPVPRSLPPRLGRDFEVIGLNEPDFYPTNRPLGIAPEFRTGYSGYW